MEQLLEAGELKRVFGYVARLVMLCVSLVFFFFILKNIANIAFSSSFFFIFYSFTFFVFTNSRILVTVDSITVRTTNEIKLLRVI